MLREKKKPTNNKFIQFDRWPVMCEREKKREKVTRTREREEERGDFRVEPGKIGR